MFSRYARRIAVFSFLAFGLVAQTSDPWTAADLMAPEVLAKAVTDKKAPPIFYVGFPNLYKSMHIPQAVLAGPVAKPEGVEALKAALANVSRDQEIVIYCGCCPMEKCPNLRPAFRIVREMGFSKAKVVPIPTNMHTDWVTKGYPSERPAAPAGALTK